jgi:hypothetical protein
LALHFFGDYAGIPPLAGRPRSYQASNPRKEFVMRVTGSILALSLLVSATPAFAQGSGSYDTGNPYNRQYTNQNRYEYYPSQQDQMRYGQTQQGPWQQGQYGENQQGSWQQGQMQPGPTQQMMMQHHQRMMQQGQMGHGMQGGYAPHQMGQADQSPRAPVSFSTQNQIKQSLETSGFKNVAVMPQSFLIRATAPDGSKVLMQVSSEGLYGVVVNSADQGGTSNSASAGGTSSGTGSTSTGDTGTGNASSSTGSASAGNTSSTGTTGTGSTGAGNTSGTGSTSGTGGTTSSSSGTGNH